MNGNSLFEKSFLDNFPLEPTRNTLPLLLILAKNFVFWILISKDDGYFLEIYIFQLRYFD